MQCANKRILPPSRNVSNHLHTSWTAELWKQKPSFPGVYMKQLTEYGCIASSDTQPPKVIVTIVMTPTHPRDAFIRILQGCSTGWGNCIIAQ